MSEDRLRVLVACGAAGGIAATFNAPLTGLFFGFEIILRAFSLDAVVRHDPLGGQRRSGEPGVLRRRPVLHRHAPRPIGAPPLHLFATRRARARRSGLVGFGFKTLLYRLEDLADARGGGDPSGLVPPSVASPSVALLLALPEMYGVGYPVMDKAISGQVVLWLLVVFMVGKILATSLTLSIGGSGGIFAPSLFIGAMAGMAFGAVAHLFGHVVSSPAIFGIVAMGAVFGAAPRRHSRP